MQVNICISSLGTRSPFFHNCNIIFLWQNLIVAFMYFAVVVVCALFSFVWTDFNERETSENALIYLV